VASWGGGGAPAVAANPSPDVHGPADLDLD